MSKGNESQYACQDACLKEPGHGLGPIDRIFQTLWLSDYNIAVFPVTVSNGTGLPLSLLDFFRCLFSLPAGFSWLFSDSFPKFQHKQYNCRGRYGHKYEKLSQIQDPRASLSDFGEDRWLFRRTQGEVQFPFRQPIQG